MFLDVLVQHYKPLAFSLVCVSLHFRLVCHAVNRLGNKPRLAMLAYGLGVFILFSSFFWIALRFSEARTVVIGVYLGYNIYYIVWGIYKSLKAPVNSVKQTLS